MNIAPVPPSRPAAAAQRPPAVLPPVAPRAEPVAHAQNEGKGWLARLNDGVLWLLQGMTTDPPQVKVVENPSVRYALPRERQEAAVQVAARAGAERAAIAHLGPRAADYEMIAALIDLPKQATAHLALQSLLLDGRLVGKKDRVGEGDVLAHLAAIARRPVAPGVDRGLLLNHLVQELDNPIKITQGGKSTCTVTAMTMLAARKNPAEIARLVAGLATPTGTAKLATGQTLTREPDWADTGDGGRTVSMRLLAPALMEWGNGGWRGYDGIRDADTIGGKSIGLAGLGAGGTKKVAEALSGDHYRSVTIYRWNRGAAVDRLEAAVAAGRPVPVTMIWEEGGLHQLVVESLQGPDVILFNPAAGSRERMSREQLRTRVQRVLQPK